MKTAELKPGNNAMLLLIFFSDEKTHASFKRALDDVCQVVRPIPELPAVARAMAFYQTLHGKEDKRKQEAASRLAFCS